MGKEGGLSQERAGFDAKSNIIVGGLLEAGQGKVKNLIQTLVEGDVSLKILVKDVQEKLTVEERKFQLRRKLKSNGYERFGQYACAVGSIESYLAKRAQLEKDRVQFETVFGDEFMEIWVKSPDEKK